MHMAGVYKALAFRDYLLMIRLFEYLLANGVEVKIAR